MNGTYPEIDRFAYDKLLAYLEVCAQIPDGLVGWVPELRLRLDVCQELSVGWIGHLRENLSCVED